MDEERHDDGRHLAAIRREARRLERLLGPDAKERGPITVTQGVSSYNQAEWDAKYEADRQAQRERGECSCTYTRKARRYGRRTVADNIALGLGPMERTETDPKCVIHGGTNAP